MMVNKYLYILGVKHRNPSLLPYLDFLMESDRWSIEQLKEYQFKKCKELLIFSQKYSSFYRREFAEVGFNPHNMQTIEDIKKLPIIDKKVLIDYNKEIHTNYKFKKIIFGETSGTTGQALGFYRDEEGDSQNRAALFRGYSWYGVAPWERNGYFWGYNIDKRQRRKVEFLDLLQNRFRIFSYDEASIRQFIEKMRTATFIEGYSSMIYEAAKIINKLEHPIDFDLKMVKGTSEKIFDTYQDETQKAFGKKIVSEYGSCESGLIAYECPEGGHMHIAMENVYVEEVDGEIVITNLMFRSFPIIRYRLGDAIKLAPSDFKCQCGRSHPIILDVLGRIGKNVIGKNNKYPSLTFYYIFKNIALTKGVNLNYQAIQNEVGNIELNIEQNSPELLSDLQHELVKYFNSDVSFSIHWGTKLHAMDGKLRDFVTTLE